MIRINIKRWLSIGIFIVALFNNAFAQEDGRVSVPETHVSLVPPEGFELTKDFVGFIHLASSSAIQVVEQAGINPDPAITTLQFTPEVLEPQGFKLESKEVVTTKAGVTSTLVLVSFNVETMDFLRYILITGSDKTMVILNANFPAMTKEYLQAKMLESILTVKVD